VHAGMKRPVETIHPSSRGPAKTSCDNKHLKPDTVMPFQCAQESQNNDCLISVNCAPKRNISQGTPHFKQPTKKNSPNVLFSAQFPIFIIGFHVQSCWGSFLFQNNTFAAQHCPIRLVCIALAFDSKMNET